MIELAIAAPEDERLTGARLDQSEQQAQRRRLARPVRAEQAGYAAVGEREGHLVDRDEVAVALRQRPHADDRGSAGAARRWIAHLAGHAARASQQCEPRASVPVRCNTAIAGTTTTTAAKTSATLTKRRRAGSRGPAPLLSSVSG